MLDTTPGAVVPPPALDLQLAAIGWTRSELARRLDVDTSTVDRWAKGRRADPRVTAWLAGLVAHLSRHPAPPGWAPRSAGRPPGRS